MCKFELVHLGPRARLGAELVEMLTTFPKAMFIEKDPGCYEVTAESDFELAANARPTWRAVQLVELRLAHG